MHPEAAQSSHAEHPYGLLSPSPHRQELITGELQHPPVSDLTVYN